MKPSEKILIALEEAGLKKQDLAKRIGINNATLSRWLSDKIRKIPLDAYEAIARVTGKPISFFLNEMPSNIQAQKIPLLTWQEANHLASFPYPKTHEHTRWIDSTLSGKQLFALEIVSEQMEPEFCRGETIIAAVIEPADARSKDYVIVADTQSDHALLFRYQRYHTITILESLHPRYTNLELADANRYVMVAKVLQKIKSYLPTEGGR